MNVLPDEDDQTKVAGQGVGDEERKQHVKPGERGDDVIQFADQKYQGDDQKEGEHPAFEECDAQPVDELLGVQHFDQLNG